MPKLVLIIEETSLLLDSTHARIFCTDGELACVEKNPSNAVLFFSIKESVIKAHYEACGKLTEMRDINCLELLHKSSRPNIKVEYAMTNQHIISLCMIRKN